MLLGQRMGSELVKGSTLIEVEKLNKELENMNHTLKETLDANTLLGDKIKEIEMNHARLIEEKSFWLERCFVDKENVKRIKLKKQGLNKSFPIETGKVKLPGSPNFFCKDF